ncbi:hypothetical protein B0A48_13819 [Cryoendolithus antarcticus]|uniref:Uncharacterized protein n=1 Tax=Cryoendolithus antarcticus TaxID=1507870 RepID=A0A1V8SN19_9PEZI|nr:hypothetical protein B0A48_13819 [Cryoendolithus antarcticus]
MADHYLLLQAYRTLTFRFQNSPDDHSRFEAFKLLVIRHLLAFEFVDYYGETIQGSTIDLETWNNAANKHKFLYSFITTYGQKLWPGKVAERGHLAFPEVRVKGQLSSKSFVAAFDGKWGAKRKGGHKAVPQDEFELAGMSRIGYMLRAYIEVLLVGGLARDGLKGMKAEEVLVEMATKLEGVKVVEQGEMTREDYIALGLLREGEESGEVKSESVLSEQVLRGRRHGGPLSRERKTAFDKLLLLHAYSHGFSIDRDFLIASFLATYGRIIWPEPYHPRPHLFAGAIAYRWSESDGDAATGELNESADPVQWRVRSLIGTSLAAYFEALMVVCALETYNGPKATPDHVIELLKTITQAHRGVKRQSHYLHGVELEAVADHQASAPTPQIAQDTPVALNQSVYTDEDERSRWVEAMTNGLMALRETTGTGGPPAGSA